MNHSRHKQRRPRRTASVVIAVLVVILLVGMLSVQTIQTLALVRRADDDRAKIMQAKELSELARAIDWSTAESSTITIQIPESASPIASSPIASKSVASGIAVDPRMQTAKLDRQTLADNPQTSKIQIRFPADEPGEITTTWETEDE